MKIGAHVETKELPGDVVMGVGGMPPNISPVPNDHIFRELTRTEQDFGVVADDPDSFKLTLRIATGIWMAIGAIIGFALALGMVQWGIIHVVIVR